MSLLRKAPFLKVNLVNCDALEFVVAFMVNLRSKENTVVVIEA